MCDMLNSVVFPPNGGPPKSISHIEIVASVLSGPTDLDLSKPQSVRFLTLGTT